MENLFDKQKVYELLLMIPRGKVITYGDLAKILGNKTWAVRSILRNDEPISQKSKQNRIHRDIRLHGTV